MPVLLLPRRFPDRSRSRVLTGEYRIAFHFLPALMRAL